MKHEKIKSNMESSENNDSLSSTLPLLKGSKSTDILEFRTLFVRNTKLARGCVMVTNFCFASALASFYGILMVYMLSNFTPETDFISLYVTLALCSVFQLFGGMLGDAVFGHYETIKYGFICSMCGLVFMSFISEVTNPSWLLAYSQVGSFIMSIGVGLLKFNVACFGADQISITHDHEIRTFFNYLQFSASIGMLVGFKVFNRIFNQQTISTLSMYLSIYLLVGLIIFLLPRKDDYHIISPSQKLRCKFFQIIFNAMRRKR